MNQDAKVILQQLGKYFLLAVALSYPVLALMLDILWLGNHVGENSVTEHSQAIILLLIMGTFFHINKKYPDQRAFGYLALGLFTSMFIREHDFFLNNIIDNLWEVIVAIVVISAITLSVKSKQPFVSIFKNYLLSHAGHIMAISLILLLFYSRLFGMGIIWENLLDDGYVRTVKNAMEEGTELLAYVMLFYATQLYRLQLKNKA